MKKTLFMAAIAAVALASCKKNDSNASATGTGTQSQMSYQLTATNTSGSVGQKTTANSIVWTSGFANPELIKFEAKQGNTEIEYKSTNTTQIDLMSPTPISFGGFTLPDGTYNEIELQIFLEKNGPAPALQIEGQFTSGTVSFPVKLVVNEEIQLKTELDNVTVTNGDVFIALTNMDLSLATTGLKESMLLSGTLTNGMLIISHDSNKMIYDMIIDNLRSRKHHCEFEHHHK